MATLSHRSKERVILAPSREGSFRSVMVGRRGEQLGSGRSLGSKLHAGVCSRLENSLLELVGDSGDLRVHEPKRNLTVLPGSEAPSQVM